MPRPELYPVKKIVGFDRRMIDAIEKWRSKQNPIPNVSEAIRRLVEQALATSQPNRPPSSASQSKSSEMAGREIDRMGDQAATGKERSSRKRRLLKGPKEFRDMRGDQPKSKR